MEDTLFYFSVETWEHNVRRLVNQIYKLLPMYEKQEDWKNQLNTLILELKGYNKMFYDRADFMILIAKLLSLYEIENQFSFRKTIFEAISCLKGIKI